MKPHVTPRARIHLDRAITWWREHRPSARDLLEREYAAVLDLLETTPRCGEPYEEARRPVRRVLLPRTKYYVYYELDMKRDLIKILMIWSAVRGRGPRL